MASLYNYFLIILISLFLISCDDSNDVGISESRMSDEDFQLYSREVLELSKYIEGDYSSGTELNIDSEIARNYSNESIEIVRDLVKFNNKIITSSKTHEELSARGITTEEFRIEEVELDDENSPLNVFFQKASEMGTPQNNENNNEEEGDRTIANRNYYTQQYICGWYSFPRPNRGSPWSNLTFSNINSANNYLIRNGFHQSPWWAGGGWTKDATYQPQSCNYNSFRQHAYTYQGRSGWILRVQWYFGFTPRGEPSPEIHRYAWPYPDWPVYVNWWHRYIG